MCLYEGVVSAFTQAEIDATLTRLEAEYEKLNHMEESGLGGRAEFGWCEGFRKRT